MVRLIVFVLFLSFVSFANSEYIMKNFKKLGGDPIALKQALCFYDTYKDTYFFTLDEDYEKRISIGDDRYIILFDMVKPSTFKRLYVIDLETGYIKSVRAGHGRGRDDHGTANSEELATYFSNDFESWLTSRGFMILGNEYRPDPDGGLSWGIRQHGVQDGINNNVLFRGVVFHYYGKIAYEPPATSDDDFPVLYGDIAKTSFGCTHIATEHWAEMLDKFSMGLEGHEPIPNHGGALMYNYTNIERDKGEDYCGDNLMIVD